MKFARRWFIALALLVVPMGVLTTTFEDDPFAHIVQGYPEALNTLVRAVEVKDAYTHGHSQRTAQLAVELGLQMGLPPDRLRVISRGCGLVGRNIPFEARVVAVADVWDALTSDRPYRVGWEPPVALAHIVDGRTTHFDPIVVDALVQWAAARGITPALGAGHADEAWRAGETCHEVDPVREHVTV